MLHIYEFYNLSHGCRQIEAVDQTSWEIWDEISHCLGKYHQEEV